MPANTGAAGARLRVKFFAGAPAPTKIDVRLTGGFGSVSASGAELTILVLPHMEDKT